MVSLKKYDLSGNTVGEVQIDDRLVSLEVSPQMVKDYVVAVRANARQWSANTKTRSEVNHSGLKPHPQKGTGKARQGCLAAPQYKGGGVVFGPKPKFDQHTRINKKERRSVIAYLLAQKIKNGTLSFLKFEEFSQPKTKLVVDFLKKVGSGNKKVLFLGDLLSDGESLFFDERNVNFVKSLRNIPKVRYMSVPTLGGYDVLLFQEIVVLEPAYDQLISMLERVV